MVRTVWKGYIPIIALAGTVAQGADVFIAQTPAGVDSGLDCPNAHSAAWFNANATGGNRYLLCGRFTGAAGGVMLSPPSGSAGNVLTVSFGNDAMMTAPHLGGISHGAIDVIGKSYVTIDGSSNGVIENTANGTALAYQTASQGIYIQNSSHIEIRNLTIRNIYRNGGSDPNATDEGGTETSDIRVVGHNGDVSIHDNTLMAARAGVRVDFDSSTIDGIHVYGNRISDHSWGVSFGAGNGGESATNVTIHDNEITDWSNWQCPAYSPSFCVHSDRDIYHTDGVILFQPRGNSVVFEPDIYNNYIHGDLGYGSPTAFIYCTTPGAGSGAASVSCRIFNNLLVNEGNPRAWILSTGRVTGGHQIYNNTLIGRSATDGTAMMLSGTDTVLRNNIVSTVRLGIGSYIDLPSVVASSDHNVWHNVYGGPTTSMFGGNDGATWYKWAQWQALGQDLASSLGDPWLDEHGRISSVASSAVDLGENLTSKAIPALDRDLAGVHRSASGSWEAGAYELGPTAPRGLRVHR